MHHTISKSGFTLIELSLVLVIIGLVAGGIFVGKDLIRAAEVRSQVAQIESYNTAVNSFVLKYNAIPGDMGATIAGQYLFPPFDAGPNNRGGTQGRGDGNGVLDAFTTGIISNPSNSLSGEVTMFWGDLTFAGLIDGKFTTDQTDGSVAPASSITGASLYDVLPTAKIGRGTFVTVYGYNKFNYYQLLTVTSVTAPNAFYSPGGVGLTVIQANSIDAKIDDGQPTTGSVQATIFGTLTGGVAGGSATSCYNSTTGAYSINTAANSGTGINCALSFQFPQQ